MFKTKLNKKQAKSLIGFSVIASGFLIKKYMRYAEHGLENNKILLLLASLFIIISAVHQGVSVLLEPEENEENKHEKLLKILNNKILTTIVRALPIVFLILFIIVVMI